MSRIAISALLVTAMTMSACSVPGRDPGTGTSSSSSSSSSARPSTGEAATFVDGVKIRAKAGAADRGRTLTIVDANVAIPDADARIASSKAVRIQLNGGKVQPSAPLTVTFDLSERPDLSAKITDDVFPVVETSGSEDPSRLDMFVAKWDPADKTVSADLTHLTDVRFSLMDIGKAVGDGVKTIFDKIRGDSTSPCREHSEVTIDDRDYTLTAVSPGAIAGCLVNNDGAPAVDFENATGSFYAITVAPDSSGGVWNAPDPMDMSDAAGSMFSGVVVGSRGVLLGRSNGRLTMDKGVDEFDVRMLPQQQGILAKSLMSGISMLGVDLGTLDLVPEAWDCIATSIKATRLDSNFSPDDLYSMITSTSQCIVTLAKAKDVDGVRGQALHRLGSAVELFALGQQFIDLVAGEIQDLAGDSVKDFRIRTKARSTDTQQAPSVADGMEITTFAYDRVQGNTYKADNAGGKKLAVFVKPMAGDKEIRDGCRTTVTVSGPGISKTVDTKRCKVGDPGEFFDIRAPGEYLVTATIARDGQPDITSQITVTILPH